MLLDANPEFYVFSFISCDIPLATRLFSAIEYFKSSGVGCYIIFLEENIFLQFISNRIGGKHNFHVCLMLGSNFS